MPRIPVRRERQVGAAPRAALENVQSAGRVQEAQANLLGQVSRTASNISNQIATAENNDFAFRQSVERRGRIQQFITEDRANNGASGHEKRLQDFIAADDRRVRSQAPRGSAFTQFQRKSLNFTQSAQSDARNFERRVMVENAKTALSDGFEQMRKGYLVNPDFSQFDLDLDLMDEQIDQAVESGVYSPDQLNELRKQVRARGADALFDGLFQTATSENGNLQKGLALLEGKGEGSDLVAAMDEKDLNQHLKKFRSAQSTRQMVSLSEARAQASDLVASMLAGDKVDQRSVDQVIAKVQANEQSKPEQVNRMLNDIRAASVVGEGISQIKVAPRSEWAEIKAGVVSQARGKDKLFGARSEQRMQVLFENSIKRVVESQKDDAFSYSLEVSAELRDLAEAAADGNSVATQALAEKQLAFQREQGVPKEFRRITSKGQAGEMAQNLIAIQDPLLAAQQIDILQDQYGPHSIQLMSEMAKADKRIADMSLAMYFDDPQAKSNIIENARQKSTIDRQFRENFPNDRTKIRDGVAKKMQEIRIAMTLGSRSPSRLQMAESFQEQVITEARKLRLRRGSSGSLNDVIEDAFDSLVGVTFSTVTAGRSTVLIPKNLERKNVDAQTVESFVNVHSDVKGLKRIKARPPEVKASFFRNQGLTESEIREAWYENLKDNHRWITNDSQDGLLLVYEPPGESPQVAKNEDGEFVEFSFEEIMGVTDEAIIADRNRFLRDFRGSGL